MTRKLTNLELDQAHEIVHGFKTDLMLVNSLSRFVGSITWAVETGFNLVGEIEYYGPEYQATRFYPAERVMLPGPRIDKTMFKFSEVLNVLAYHGFEVIK